MVEVKEVSKTYGRTTALSNISLRVEAGKTTTLIGPSGCGKSTLIRVLAGLIRPDSGEVTIQGTPIRDDNILQLRHRMGYVIQDGGLFPHLTGEQNALLLGRYLGREEKQLQERLQELAALTKLRPGALDQYPTQLSGGQQQRVSLIRALMLDPDILLLDEPMGALDPMIRSELQDDLREIFVSLKKTVVMVTHDLGEAFFFGHTIVLLQQGRIVQQGSFEDLRNHPADPFVTRFIEAQRSPLEKEGK